jgi:hypothetical protein
MADSMEGLAVLYYELADVCGVHARTAIPICCPSVSGSGVFS